jgi:glycosyltransferase involved in cell wall biosynthesis
MKLLWLCNMAPSAVQEKLSGKREGGMWIDRVLAGLRLSNCTIRVLFPLDLFQEGSVDSSLSFSTFTEGAPYVYMPELEAYFKKEVEALRPDVIHIWGTEYGHTLAMINAAEQLDMLDRTVIHIQGLCSVIARHYSEGVPHAVQKKFTFRDLLRQDNIAQQQKKFVRRGELEIKALQKARHVTGRTDWDKACVKQINPDVQYHFCNETLRGAFYDGQWEYENCRKHRIFASSCSYPVKGFHYLLEAFAEVVKAYPDATLAVTGQSCFPVSFQDRLRQSSYQKYLADLIRRYGLEDKVEFLGGLSAERMKENYLKANVFVLPSTIENSPNSLGEAMLLGVPCVASDVGGVTSVMKHNEEGYIYQSSAPYMLAYYIKSVFDMGEKAEKMGLAARVHARITHNPENNLQQLLKIYDELMD